MNLSSSKDEQINGDKISPQYLQCVTKVEVLSRNILPATRTRQRRRNI